MTTFQASFDQGTYEDHPIAALMPLMQPAELDELVLSMRTHGYDIAHPILLLDGKILDGRNRYRAAKLAGVLPTFGTVDGIDPWDFVWRENAVRRQLEKGQKTALARKFIAGSKEWQEAHRRDTEAANRSRAQRQAGVPKNVIRTRAKDVRTKPAKERHEREKLAKLAGVSPRTADKVIALEKSSPAAFERVVRGEVPLNRALAETKKAAVVAEIKAKPKPLPDGKHHVIVIDPPWRYDARAENRDVRGTVDYPDMSIEEICALPIGKLAEDNCILWLWTTNAFMRDAFKCLDAWGFAEKTILTWDKERIGVGHWLRNVTEHCILAVRGKPVVELTNQSTILRAPRREHSRKPDEFYDLVEKLCPGSKVEIFAREPRKGWSSWGAEQEKFRRAL